MNLAKAFVLGIACLLAIGGSTALSPAHAETWIELPEHSGQAKVYIAVVKTSVPGKAPVAIMLHGGAGIDRYSLAALEKWAEWLGHHGISSVIVDSYRGRGIRHSDDIGGGDKWVAHMTARVDDIDRTHAWLATQDWADPARTFIFGQSLGGGVAIAGATEKGVTLPQVLTYPYCPRWILAHLTPKAGYPPSLWLSGDEDDVATPSETRACAAGIAAAGNPAAIKLVMLHAKHGFDRDPRGIEYSGHAIEASKTEIEAFLKAHGLMP